MELSVTENHLAKPVVSSHVRCQARISSTLLHFCTSHEYISLAESKPSPEKHNDQRIWEIWFLGFQPPYYRERIEGGGNECWLTKSLSKCVHLQKEEVKSECFQRERKSQIYWWDIVVLGTRYHRLYVKLCACVCVRECSIFEYIDWQDSIFKSWGECPIYFLHTIKGIDYWYHFS